MNIMVKNEAIHSGYRNETCNRSCQYGPADHFPVPMISSVAVCKSSVGPIPQIILPALAGVRNVVRLVSLNPSVDSGQGW
jgi:hypothetical protein